MFTCLFRVLPDLLVSFPIGASSLRCSRSPPTPPQPPSSHPSFNRLITKTVFLAHDFFPLLLTPHACIPSFIPPGPATSQDPSCVLRWAIVPLRSDPIRASSPRCSRSPPTPPQPPSSHPSFNLAITKTVCLATDYALVLLSRPHSADVWGLPPSHPPMPPYIPATEP